MWEVDTRLEKLMVEERLKREKFERECDQKQGEWLRLEGNLSRWEGELNERERELSEWEGQLRGQERDLIKREGEMRSNQEREFKVFIRQLIN